MKLREQNRALILVDLLIHQTTLANLNEEFAEVIDTNELLKKV